MTDCDPPDLVLAPLGGAPSLEALTRDVVGRCDGSSAATDTQVHVGSQANRHGPWSILRTARQRHRFPNRGCLPPPATSPHAPLALSDAERQPFGDRMIPWGRHVVGSPTEAVYLDPPTSPVVHRSWTRRVPSVSFCYRKKSRARTMGLPNRACLLLRADRTRDSPLARCACRTYTAPGVRLSVNTQPPFRKGSWIYPSLLSPDIPSVMRRFRRGLDARGRDHAV
jgi:hypothetical protein